jgi:hypothetical protein
MITTLLIHEFKQQPEDRLFELIFRGSPQTIQENGGVPPESSVRLLFLITFPINYSVIALPFDAI